MTKNHASGLFTWILILTMAAAQTSIASDNRSAPAIVHDSWSSGAPMPTARQGVATGVIKGKVYVVGGAANGEILAVNEIYHVGTNTWTTGAPMPTPSWVGASAVANGILYVIGGQDNNGNLLSLVQAYDPVTNAWSTKTPMPTARNSVTAAVYKNILLNQYVIYVVGGFNYNGRLAIVESYNTATDTWTEEAPLLVGKSLAAVGLLGSKIVAAGGLSNSGITGDNEGYNVAKNMWTTLTADPTPRQAGCAWAIAGQFYFAGGSASPAGDQPLSALEAYSSKTKSWMTLASIPQAVIAPGSADVGGRLYCIGGTDNAGSLGGTVYNYVQIYQP
jgi:hypothetical protein